ncbi:hypothetical protein Misp01_30540 [Microtetraspora sp. NBRC 13810]|uniref:hypothetical protein n=1 Tax=Microtetraspora sp. NBRC 13810 TaxID=3030990 RepID=UPI0024A489D3|nr:hypothetical protein [Microtetraspora sp. NBRC 13810]GLW07924.1 hypothetical protein Misp01_30540 [Microtetraspora sp. NBRC 13810]
MIDDEALIAALSLAAGRDPVPAGVPAAARHAYTRRTPGAVTAGRVGVPAASGIRSGGGPRLLRFAAAGLAVDVEITVTDGLVDLAGQVTPVPAPGAHVEIRTLHLGQTRALSETGHFAATGLPPGWFSIVCHRPSGPPIATSWARIRP